MKNKAQNSNSRQVRGRGLKRRNEETQEVGNTFVANLRAEAPQAAEGIMLVEVISLCGERYRPLAEAGYRRAGSEVGVLRYDGRKENIVRPRVRTADGEREVTLESYRQIKAMSNHGDIIGNMVGEGISCRGLSRAMDGALGKSAIAEQWARKGAEQLEALRSKDLSQMQWTVLMVDGVFEQRAVRDRGHRGGPRWAQARARL